MILSSPSIPLYPADYYSASLCTFRSARLPKETVAAVYPTFIATSIERNNQGATMEDKKSTKHKYVDLIDFDNIDD